MMSKMPPAQFPPPQVPPLMNQLQSDQPTKNSYTQVVKILVVLILIHNIFTMFGLLYIMVLEFKYLLDWTQYGYWFLFAYLLLLMTLLWLSSVWTITRVWASTKIGAVFARETDPQGWLVTSTVLILSDISLMIFTFTLPRNNVKMFIIAALSVTFRIGSTHFVYYFRAEGENKELARRAAAAGNSNASASNQGNQMQQPLMMSPRGEAMNPTIAV